MSKDSFHGFMEVTWEYFEMGHAEQVPLEELGSPHMEEYYLPINAVHNEDSATNKLQIVSNVLAKTALSTLLKDLTLIEVTLQPLLVNILL